MALLQSKLGGQGAAMCSRVKQPAASVRAPVCRGSRVQGSTQAPFLQQGGPRFAGATLPAGTQSRVARRNLAQALQAYKDGQQLDRPLRVAVIGGGE